MLGLRRSWLTWLLTCAGGLAAVGVIATLAPADPLSLGATPACDASTPAGPPPGQPDCLGHNKGL